MSSHRAPDHRCQRCDRAVYSYHDHGKLELSKYYDGVEKDHGFPDFVVLCRFCMEEVDAWLCGDEIQSHIGVDDWDIPEEQKAQYQISQIEEGEPAGGSD